jgi:hypothetical protein
MTMDNEHLDLRLLSIESKLELLTARIDAAMRTLAVVVKKVQEYGNK